MQNRRNPKGKTEQEFDQKLIDVARVTRVMAGGKRMRFRATLAIGDRKGSVGIGMAKGLDVTIAIQKAFNQAKKNLIKVPVIKGTVPHEVWSKFNATKVMLKPAKPGAGVKAGGPMRMLLELAGVQDVTAKILGSNNKINIVKATMQAFTSFKSAPVKKEVVAEKKVEVAAQ